MTSPTMTVLVLAVLWLIVVVPMIVRRHDDRANERSVEQFGKSMRALTRRHVAMTRAGTSVAAVPAARRVADGTELFVSGTRPAALAPSMRRPVPAAEEALMYPADRSDARPLRALGDVVAGRPARCRPHLPCLAPLLIAQHLRAQEVNVAAESAVRIDDDDVALHNHDTVDLTGLYDEDAVTAGSARRRAS